MIEVTIQKNNGGWTAQEYVQQVKFELPHDQWEQRIGQYVVFGMYLMNGNYSGIHVRFNPSSTVVNVYSGARTTWAVPVSEVELDNFFNTMDKRRKSTFLLEC